MRDLGDNEVPRCAPAAEGTQTGTPRGKASPGDARVPTAGVAVYAGDSVRAARRVSEHALRRKGHHPVSCGDSHALSAASDVLTDRAAGGSVRRRVISVLLGGRGPRTDTGPHKATWWKQDPRL